MKKLLALSLGALLLSAPVAMADDHESGARDDVPTREQKVMKNDTDGDGFISKSEFMDAANKRAEEMFAKMDKDGDGKISRAEKKEAKGEMREKMKERHDKMKEHREHRMEHGDDSTHD